MCVRVRKGLGLMPVERAWDLICLSGRICDQSLHCENPHSRRPGSSWAAIPLLNLGFMPLKEEGKILVILQPTLGARLYSRRNTIEDCETYIKHSPSCGIKDCVNGSLCKVLEVSNSKKVAYAVKVASPGPKGRGFRGLTAANPSTLGRQ
ncbi:hypothetical protein LguiB_005900 [Lonicera macranthoides]